MISSSLEQILIKKASSIIRTENPQEKMACLVLFLCFVSPSTPKPSTLGTLELQVDQIRDQRPSSEEMFSQKKHGKKHPTFGPFFLWGGKNMENCGRCNLFVIDEWWNFRRIWNFQLHRSFLLEIIVELRFCVSLHVWKYWMKCCSWTKQLLYVFSLLKTRSTFLTINAWATWVDQDWDHLAAWPWV